MVRNFNAASHSHRNMIFLSSRSRQIVDARRVSQDLGFVEKRDRRDVRNHEAGLHAGMLRKEGGQSFVQSPDSSGDRFAVR